MMNLTFLKKSRAGVAILILASVFNSGAVQAESTQAKSVVEKVLQAYGGSTLTELKSIKIIDYNKGPWPGESEHPGVPEIWRINEELIIDFKKQRKSMMSYRAPRTTRDLEKWIADQEKVTVYDILHQKYTHPDWANYEWLGSSLVRSSDTMQARRLQNDATEIAYLEQDFYRGEVHHKLQVKMKSGAEFIYYVSEQTGLIMKVIREHPYAGKQVYVFSNHHQIDGVTYARDMDFFVNGELRLTSVKRGIELNPDMETAFKGFDNYTSWGEPIDSSKLMAKQLADGVYQAGSGFAMPVFWEQEDHYIAMGSAASIKETLAAVQELAGNQKPLGHFIVSHHHRGNLQGLKEVVKLGARLVVVDEHKATILDSLGDNAPDARFLTVNNRQPLTLGPLTLFDLPTAHSQHLLTAYLPKEKMIFSDAYYSAETKAGIPRVTKDMKIFAREVEALKIDATTLVDVNYWRQIRVEDLMRWTRHFVPKTCPKGYPICENG